MNNITQTEKCECLCYEAFYTGTAKTNFINDNGTVTAQKNALYLNIQFDGYGQG